MNPYFVSTIPWPLRWIPAPALAALALTGGGRAADIYLKLDGIPGEISTGRFTGWSRLEVASASAILPPAVAPAPAAPPELSLSVSKQIDKATPHLMQRCASHDVIPRLTLAFVDGQTPYLRITLQDVLVTGITHGAGTDAGSPPSESVSFSYQKIEWSTTEQNGDGSGLTTTYDTATQTGTSRPRVPFRASLERRPGENVVRITCPVETGHRYRIAGNATLAGRWQPLSEFTATTNGMVEQQVPLSSASFYLRVEEME